MMIMPHSEIVGIAVAAEAPNTATVLTIGAGGVPAAQAVVVVVIR